MTRSGDVKSFFRQQKAHTKPTGGVSKRASAHHQKAAPAVLAHSVLPDHGAGGEEEERAAREFDMDMRYGPCLDLAPPPALLALCADDQACLWEGRV